MTVVFKCLLMLVVLKLTFLSVFPGKGYHHFMFNEKGSTNQPISHRLIRLFRDPRVTLVQRQFYEPRELRFIESGASSGYDPRFFIPPADNEPQFNDPLYSHQWYLHGRSKRHVNAVPAWTQGLSGKGIYIVVLDDSVNPSNPEIAQNYDPLISADLGEHEGPGIRKNPVHGTYCASVVAGKANNSICGVGVAFNARVGGIRLLAKKRVLDVQEAKGLNYALGKVDIYSASWGPPDNGKHIGGPKRLAFEALQRGVHEGRKGLGAIYVWASGNGGSKGDNCGYDGYASSVYTITVSSLTREGLSPFYAEACPAALTSVYVGGSHQLKPGLYNEGNDVVVPEADGNGCNDKFEGTSAAAPIAAGAIALLLEANPKLSWRDVQHLIVLSSFPSNKQDEWQANGAGLKSNVFYGFGALDAARLVETGRQWKRVPDQKTSTTLCPMNEQTSLDPNGVVQFTLPIENSTAISSLEYVTVTMSVDIVPRGRLSVSLASPSGFVSSLLAVRKNDFSRVGFSNWNLTTAQFWNENPLGTWRLSFMNNGRSPGLIKSCSLTLYGF